MAFFAILLALAGGIAYVQDANYNVVGVFNKGNTSGSNLSNLLGEQYSWTPYGEVSARAVNSGLPHSRIGHQGLFWDTLEVRGAEVLKPGDAGIYYNRNRFYSPRLGRFLNRDPNGTAVALLSHAHRGQRPDLSFGIFAFGGKGLQQINLHAALVLNPATRRDPLGLYSAMDEDVDDLIWGLTGERAAAAHHIFSSIGLMAQVAATAVIEASLASMFPPFGVYLAAEGAAEAIEDMLFNGPTLSNSALLGLSVFGGVGSSMALLATAERAFGRITAGLTDGYQSAGRQYAKMGLARSGFTAAKSEARLYSFWRAKQGSGRAGLGLSMDDAIAEVRAGGDIVAASKSSARAIAERVGNGPPTWERGHAGGPPHYHATSGGDRVGGHIFY